MLWCVLVAVVDEYSGGIDVGSDIAVVVVAYEWLFVVW